MHISRSILSIAATILTVANAAPTSVSDNQPYRLVHQFPNGTFVENFAIRPNGELVATDAVGAQIFLVDPFSRDLQNNAKLLKSGEKNTSVTGITEVERDVFYFIRIGNSDPANFKFGANASSIYQLDLRQYSWTGKAKISKVADTPLVGIPNGLTLLSKEKGLILIADSTGFIWRFNVYTGKYEVAIDDPILKPIVGAQTEFGANGIKVIGSTLYFSSLDQTTVGTFKIDCEGNPIGKPKILTDKVPNADDFAVGRDGSVWLAENVSDKLVRIFPNSTVEDILSVTGPVSARFGRLPKDQHILYISTDGLLITPKGVLRSDGKIVALDTTKYH